MSLVGLVRMPTLGPPLWDLSADRVGQHVVLKFAIPVLSLQFISRYAPAFPVSRGKGPVMNHNKGP